MQANGTVLEQYNSGASFLAVYPDYDLSLLPDWVIESLPLARIIGAKKQTVILPNGQKYQLNNSLNHMSGQEWVFFINSVLNTRYLTAGPASYAHSIRKIHPSPKPPQLMRDIILFFTKKNELVFDCFMGVGGTLLGAAMCNRNAAGIDLNSDFIKAYQLATEKLALPCFPTKAGDALSVLKKEKQMNGLLGSKPISLLLIDPPYGDMMSKLKTGADITVYGKTGTPFTSDSRDLGNMSSESFLEALKKSIELILPRIKHNGHVVIFVKDMQPSKKKLNMLHYDVISKINEIPQLFYKGMRIWADQTAKLFPYGYPFSFVANQIHQYILVFRKENC